MAPDDRRTRPHLTMTPESTDRRPTLDLSLTQVVAAALGAVAATALAGRLHLAGSLLGAAVVAVVATIATALATLWLRRGRHRIRRSATVEPDADWGRMPPGGPSAAAGGSSPPAPSARSKAVLAGVVGGITAAALLTASGHGVLDVRVDAGAVEALQRGITAFADNVRTWAARA